MNRNCPHCGNEIHVFDEECGACGKPSKPSFLLAAASILHGYRSLIFLAAVLAVSWFIMSKIFK